jgi:cephalosporin-C deacetylase
MPLVDMSIEELLRYKGTSPCPADIDEYWDNAIAEMQGTDSQTEIIPSEFKVPYADCYDLYYTGVKGARIHAKYLRPKDVSKSSPALIILHGYSANCGDWNDKLCYVAAGFSVFALDCRGQGGKSEDVGGVKGATLNGHIIRGLDGDDKNDLLFRHVFLDTAQLVKIAMSMPGVGADRVGVTGGSQGGGLTLACAALAPKVKKIALLFPFLSDYKRVWEMDLANDAYAELKDYFRKHDPFHKREDEIFEKLGYIDVQNITNRINAEVLMFTGLMDTICPPSTQFAAYNKINSDKNVTFLPDFGHEGLPEVNDIIFEYMMGL